jgi:tetratricopeptide (TPR) repeat protein
VDDRLPSGEVIKYPSVPGPPTQPSVAGNAGEDGKTSAYHPLEPTGGTQAMPVQTGETEVVADSATLQVGGASPAQPEEERGMAPLHPGTLVGRYMVIEKIGAGGLGQVYAAYDPELDRKVALKVLLPSIRGGPGDLQARLRREAQAMAKLAHPNVVAVHDVGTHDDQVFIAMELVEGLTLSKWVKKQPRSWQEIRDVVCQAGQGLVAAHAAGMVHRDFKPGNVMIGTDGRVRVLDFGLARAAGADASASGDRLRRMSASSSGRFPGDSLVDSDPAFASPRSPMWTEAITREGLVIGTPAYMPPEQLRHRELDGRADQFAFCVTLHWTLYRCVPFKASSPSKMLALIRAGELPPVPADCDVPGWLRLIIVKGLSADREERYPSMADILHALQHDQRSRRRQWAVVAAAAGLAVILGGAGVVALQQRNEAAVVDEVDVLSADARAAAAEAYFVYPPPEDPDRPTAYNKVLALEALGTSQAAARATELREEFSATLTRLGDDYWEEEGGRPFAADYYVAALVFDPANAHAQERSFVTPGELSLLRKKAHDLDFSEAELDAAQPLVALAEQDETKRVEKVAALYRKKRVRRQSTSENLGLLLGPDAEPVLQRARAAARPSAPAAQQKAAAPPEPEPEPSAKPESEVAEASPAPSSRGPAPETTAKKRDPKAAAAEAREGLAALKRRALAVAETHFNRALDADPRNLAAISGLGDVHFERGNYQRAVRYADKAVRIAPNKGSYRIKLGDAYLKVLQLSDARKQYEKAKSLGDRQAAGRLALVDKRLGK